MRKNIVLLAIGLLAIGLLFCMTTNSIKAEESSSSNSDQKNFFVGGMPQYMFLNALRFETEYRPDNSHLAFTFSPQIYYGYLNKSIRLGIENREKYDPYSESNTSFTNNKYDEDEIFGYGAEMGVKYYLNNKYVSSDGINMYIGLALGYNNIDYKLVNSKDKNSIEVEEYNVNVVRFYPELQIGGSIFAFEALMIDVYVGTGLKIPTVTLPDVKAGRFDDDFFTDKGTYYFLGLKAGFFLF